MAQSISSAASAGVKLFVNTQKDPLLLRASASTTGTILARIPRGAAVTVLAFSAPSGWTAVMYGKTRGYAASQYLATSSPVSSGGATKTTTSTSSSTTDYPTSPAPTAAGITNNSTSMASDKLKTALKIGGIVAGVGLLAFGAYKIMQKKKAETAAPTATALPPARRSGGKALSGIGGGKRRKGKRKSKKTKKQKSGKGKNDKLTLR